MDQTALLRELGFYCPDGPDSPGAHDHLVEKMTSPPTESIHLEVKSKSRPEHPGPDKDDKENFAKALSAFANSDGGLLIWGFKESGRKDETSSYTPCPITNVRRFVDKLNELESGAVQPPVEGTLHLPIADEGGNGFAITVVPKSEKTPHMGRYEGHSEYYFRVGGRFERMEHYQVEDMFGRRAVPRLEVVELCVDLYDTHSQHSGTVILVLRNAGRGMASRWGIDVYIPYPYNHNLNYDQPINPLLLKVEHNVVLPCGLPNRPYTALRLRNPPELPLFADETIKVWPTERVFGSVDLAKSKQPWLPDEINEEISSGPAVRYVLHADQMTAVWGSVALNDFVELRTLHS